MPRSSGCRRRCSRRRTISARKPRTTFRKVTWPLAVPGVVAGSIFTFSLTLGDYIIPTLVGPGRPTIGSAIYNFQGTAGNLPLAAACDVIPIVVMGCT